MARRWLPPRASRGQKPVSTPADQNHDDLLYRQMFGDNLDDEEDYVEQRTKEQMRKEMFVSNIRSYPYSRGYHYFFPLDQFPRAQGQFSYAIDPQNAFKSTYLQEDTVIGPSRVCEIINRTYFCLPPPLPNHHTNKEGRCKNICHGYLFDLQDKKYHLDRLIYTFKKVYRSLDNLIDTNKLSQFKLIKNDSQLRILLDDEVDIDSKRQVLLQKIKVLEERKENNKIQWESEDATFLHHSFNQRFHDRISEMKSQVKSEIGFQRIADLLFSNQCDLSKLISNKSENLTEFLKTVFRYYNSPNPALTEESIRLLSEMYTTRIINEEQNIIFPVQIFSFGSHDLMSKVNDIIAYRIFNINESTFYTAKFIWKKLFNVEFSPYKKHYEKITNDQYCTFAKIAIEEAKSFFTDYRKTGIQQNEIQYPFLDHLLNLEDPNSLNNSDITIFQKSDVIAMSGKQFLVVILFSWICQGFNQLMPFLKANQQFQEVFISEYYSKYSHGFVEAVGSPIVGVLNTAIEGLLQILSRSDPFEQLNIKLFFQFEQDNIGIIWRMKENEVWQTESENSEKEVNQKDNAQQNQGFLEQWKANCDDQFNDFGPVKKIKEN